MDKSQKEELELKLRELLENTGSDQHDRQDGDNRRKVRTAAKNYVIRRRKGQKDKHITIN